MALGSSLQGVVWTVLVLLASGERSAEIKDTTDILVRQPRGPISVRSGGILTLECTVPPSQPGPVRWFKGEGPRRKVIFSQTMPLSRGTRRDKDSDTDFTIFLRNVVPEDAGVYYCVKQNKKPGGGDEDLQSGPGTEVAVNDAADGTLVAAATACILLILLISGMVYFCIKKRRGRSRSRHASRPESTSPADERKPRKDPNAKEIVYAEVELSKIPTTPKPRKLDQRCEYATIQPVQRVAG